MRQVTLLCDRLRFQIDKQSIDILGKPNLPLGAYGIVAYSKRSDRLQFHREPGTTSASLRTKRPSAEYQPGGAAVVGQCDLSFIYGAGSGKKMLKDIVAVCEMKILRELNTQDYHLTGGALCAQIFTSLIGSEAALGIVVTNGSFKFLWKEIIGGSLQFYTYPSGNNLASFADPVEKEFFVAVLFDVVRCSILNENISTSAQSVESPTDIRYRSWRYIISGRRSEQSHNGVSTDASTVRAADGSLHTFAPIDFSQWSPEEYANLQKQLLDEQKRTLASELIDEITDSGIGGY